MQACWSLLLDRDMPASRDPTCSSSNLDALICRCSQVRFTDMAKTRRGLYVQQHSKIIAYKSAPYLVNSLRLTSSCPFIATSTRRQTC